MQLTGDTSIDVLEKANTSNLQILHNPVRPWLLQKHCSDYW
jgi:hypothetical protein